MWVYGFFTTISWGSMVQAAGVTEKYIWTQGREKLLESL